MAELLVYNKDHWMDALLPEEVASRASAHKTFQRKYDARWQRGDVVEVRPDGYWTGPNAPGYSKAAFELNTVQGSVDDHKDLIEAEVQGEGDEQKMLKRRKSKVVKEVSGALSKENKVTKAKVSIRAAVVAKEL